METRSAVITANHFCSSHRKYSKYTTFKHLESCKDSKHIWNIWVCPELLPEMCCVQVPEMLNPILFKFQRCNFINIRLMFSQLMIWSIDNEKYCCCLTLVWSLLNWITSVYFPKRLNWIEMFSKCRRLGLCGVVCAALSVFNLMFPDSCIVRCGAEAHPHQVENANI